MGHDPGWPICQRCAKRVARYELGWIEHADGSLTTSSVLDLDARARRDAARIWHAACFAPAVAEREPQAALRPVNGGASSRYQRAHRTPPS